MSDTKDDDRKTGEREDGAPAESDGAPEPIVIRKYANRRLYNMAESSYVTLEDIAELVRDGAEFGVFDAKSGEDITSSVLLQIIVEQETSGQELLPPGFLSELIRLYDDPGHAIVPDYLNAAMAALRENLETFRRHQVIDDATGFEQLVRVSMEAFEQSLGQTTEEDGSEEAPGSEAGEPGSPGAGAPVPSDSAASDAPDDAAPDASAPDDDIRKDLETLHQQLSAMQAQIERLGRRQG